MNTANNKERCSFDVFLSYKDKIRKIQSIFFATCFSPHGDLVAGTSFGSINIWNIEQILCPQPKDSGELLAVTPHISFRAHVGPVYCLLFTGHGDGCKLISGGDECIRVWDWNDVMHVTNQKSTILPLFELNNPQSVGFKMSLSPRTETNGLSLDQQTGYLFSAGGDGMAYCWDLTTRKCVYTLKGHEDYLHCIKVNSPKQQVITGSEDGTCRVWDMRSSECVTVLSPWSGTATSAREVKSSLATLRQSNNWISCLDIDSSSDWLICGSGNKLLSLWYLPTANVVAYMPMASAVQNVIFWDDSIISVGNEEHIYYWKTTGALRMRVATNSKSLFSVAIYESVKSRVLVAAGTPPLINVYLPPFSYCSCVLSL